MRDNKIVVLTGAGISACSGVSTFRDADGIWSRVSIDDVATPEAFARDPARVHGFYNDRRRALLDPQIQANSAHKALAVLEKTWPAEVWIVTQNVDDLHERAGSENLIHMHGELIKARCDACSGIHRWRTDLSVDSRCPVCNRIGNLRPDVVWFGEQPQAMEMIYQALKDCQLFISIGTSGTVYPAAGFVDAVAARPQVRTVELNLQPSEGASLFAETRYGPASQIVPEFVAELLSER